MAGNIASGKHIDIKWAGMSLHWDNPTGADFEPWLAKMKSLDYDGVTCFSEGLAEFYNKPKALRNMLVNNGMSLAAVDYQLDGSADESLEPVMDLMNAAGCSILVCIVHGAKVKNAEAYSRYADILNIIGERTLARGISTHLHNNSDSIGRNLSDWANLMPLIDWQKVHLMLDTGHATKDFDEIPHRERAYAFLKENWHRLHYLELKDYNDATDLDTPLGEGWCDFDGIFSLIKQQGYAGWITIEQNQNNGLSLGRSPETCSVISREYVRKLLAV